MRAILLVVLLATVAFSSRLSSRHHGFHETNVAKVTQELLQSNYGSALVHMIQLHSEAEGPVDELQEAIEELINDLNTELEQLEIDFQNRTSQHNALVIELEQDISDAEIDIDRAEDVIHNLLVPRRVQLETKISNLLANQEENRKTLAEATLLRQQEHESFELAVEELNGAIAAVDEALELLASLSNSPSLAQIKKFQNTLKKIENKIHSKSKMAPMIKALITLAANQNFSNSEILGKIVSALNEFRNEVVNSINEQTAQEATNLADYEERVQQLDLEHAEFQRSINDVNVDLTATIEKIDEVSTFQAQRVSDKKMYVAQLELENNQYAEETEIYTDLKNEYLRELAVSEQALALVESADFGNIHL